MGELQNIWCSSSYMFCRMQTCIPPPLQSVKIDLGLVYLSVLSYLLPAELVIFQLV